MNEVVTQYIGDVKKELHGLVFADSFISDLRANLEEHMEYFPDATYSDLVEQFGTPETLAKEYIDNQSPIDPATRAKHRNRNLILTISMIWVIVLAIYLILQLSGTF